MYSPPLTGLGQDNENGTSASRGAGHGATGFRSGLSRVPPLGFVASMIAWIVGHLIMVSAWVFMDTHAASDVVFFHLDNTQCTVAMESPPSPLPLLARVFY